MNYGTKTLQAHNKKHAKAGDVVLLGYVARSGLKYSAGVDAERATLTRKQADGIWWADVDGSEWCIGSGYDWKIAQ